jgi:hypothetical protein
MVPVFQSAAIVNRSILGTTEGVVAPRSPLHFQNYFLREILRHSCNKPHARNSYEKEGSQSAFTERAAHLELLYSSDSFSPQGGGSSVSSLRAEPSHESKQSSVQWPHGSVDWVGFNSSNPSNVSTTDWHWTLVWVRQFDGSLTWLIPDLSSGSHHLVGLFAGLWFWPLVFCHFQSFVRWWMTCSSVVVRPY